MRDVFVFSAGEQEDAHEFWMAFSDRLREQFPPFATSFSIGVESAFVCRNCGRLPFKAAEGYGSTVFELHAWSHGDSLPDVIRCNMEDVLVDGAMCERCQERAVIGQQRRFSRIGDMMLFHIDRAAEDEERRNGAVRLPQQLCLEDRVGRKCFQLAAVSCHYGETSRSGHWVTWRPGWAAGWRAEWLIEDDETRRRPEAPDGNMEDHAALVLYRSFESTAALSAEHEQRAMRLQD